MFDKNQTNRLLLVAKHYNLPMARVAKGLVCDNKPTTRIKLRETEADLLQQWSEHVSELSCAHILSEAEFRDQLAIAQAQLEQRLRRIVALENKELDYQTHITMLRNQLAAAKGRTFWQRLKALW